MGTWIIYDLSGKNLIADAIGGGVPPAGYVAAQGAADASGVYNGNIRVGQNVQPVDDYFIFRGIGRFYLGNLLALYTLVAADILVSFNTTGFPGRPFSDFNLVLVDGSGMSFPAPAVSDFGVLLTSVVPFANLAVPAGGLLYQDYTVALTPAGLAALVDDWNLFGWRGDNDILVDWSAGGTNNCYCNIANDKNPTATSVLGTPVGTSAAVITGIINDTTKGLPKLVITVAEAIDGSNLDVCFQYQAGTVIGEGAWWNTSTQTPWVSNQAVGVNFSANLTGLFVGDWSWRVYFRQLQADGTYIYYNSIHDQFTINPASFVGGNLPNKLKAQGVI
jgi:hypothetical protein